MNSDNGRTEFDWGISAPAAPSVGRVNVVGWIGASATLGAFLGILALMLSWRTLPWLNDPPGAISLHFSYLIRSALHGVWSWAFSDAARSYAQFLESLSAGDRIALISRLMFALWVACLPAVFLAKIYLAPRNGLLVLRGSARHVGAQAAEALNLMLADQVKRRPDHPIAPDVPYPADMWTRHVLVVGGVGSGKSTALKPMIQAVIDAGESLLLFDPKGEFTKGFGEPEIMAPWDARSLAWDIAKDMRNIGDMRRFAAAMIKEAQDPMWSNAARQIVVGFMIYLKTTRGNGWGWRELAEMMSIPQANILKIMEACHPEAMRSVERASVTTQGILINLSSFCASIFDLAEAWGETPEDRRISFVEWAHGGTHGGEGGCGVEEAVGRQSAGKGCGPVEGADGRKGGGGNSRGARRQIILQGHGAYPELTKGYLEGIIGTVSAIVNSVEMDDDESRKLWIIADESAQMGKVPIRPLLEVGRSRGVRCILACQDLAQLEEIHGALMVKAMVSMAGTVLVGQLMQGDTAEQMCKALGSREVERSNISYAGNGGSGSGSSTTLSFARDEIAIYKPSELGSRLGPTPDGQGVRLALFTGGQAYELFWPHYKMKKARAAHVPAAWTQDVSRGAGFVGSPAASSPAPIAASTLAAAPIPAATPAETLAATPFATISPAAKATPISGTASVAAPASAVPAAGTARIPAGHTEPNTFYPDSSGSFAFSRVPLGASVDLPASRTDFRPELAPLTKIEPVSNELPSDLHDLPSVEELSAMLNETLDLKKKRASKKTCDARSDALND
ncbi:type IV secretion system DNA-binding domain-containing protein [Janthinobacterium sp. MDT1-19]|uniref:type IV secretion system DNA-binding domain-containing protein n=1 Tax=Janthinobacterium sp. MDT1-19 TaxID=1259339 RepID=UPI003F259DB2